MTEGETAALHRLAVPSKLHVDLATGTGTDQFCIAALASGAPVLDAALRLVGVEARGSADYAISYRINDGQPVQLAAGSPLSGAGAAFTGDVVRLLQSLPEEGDIAVRLAPRTGAAQEGHFLLGGLKMVREKVAVACKWPQAVARPRN
jgi:hypothetical protein